MADERRTRKTTGNNLPVEKRTDPESVSPGDMSALSSWLVNGKHELQAQRTLARLLRSGHLDIGLRLVLADIFDPESESDQRFILKRKRGRQRRVSAQQIAFFIWRKMQQGSQWEAAVQEAKDTFKVRSRSTITSAWRKWRPHFEGKPRPRS